MGAALAGGIGVGIFPDFSIAEKLTPIVDRTQPDPAAAGVYDRLYEAFNKCYEALEPLYNIWTEF